MEVTVPKATMSLAEANHAYPRMFLVREDGTGIFQPFSCKDFFTDFFWSQVMGQSSNVYGFVSTPGTVSMDDPWIYLAVQCQKDAGQYQKGLQAFLNKIEGAQSFPPSTVLVASNHPEILVVKASMEWAKRPYLISALSQFARSGLTYSGGDVVDHLKNGEQVCSYDKARMPEVAKRTALMMEGKVYDQKYSDYKTANYAHSVGGFISYPGMGKVDPRFRDG